MRYLYTASAALYLFTQIAGAGVVTFSGAISQSTSDGTGPPVNNMALNMIQDGDAYTVTIDFIGSISTLGTHPLAGVSMTFADSARSVMETAFAPVTSASCATFPTICVTFSADGAFDDISVLACLSSGGGCSGGNQLDANFKVPVAGLTGQNISAQPIAGLTPLDLLEDDGSTDIQGTVTNWSNNSASATVPEPSTLMLIGLLAPAWLWKRRRSK